MLRTAAVQLHALNLTSEGWQAWCRAQYASARPISTEPAAALSSPQQRCFLHFVAAGAGAVGMASAAPQIGQRAQQLALRPLLSGRLSDRARARFLIIDPLGGQGADQLDALPTMSARLARVAREMKVEVAMLFSNLNRVPHTTTHFRAIPRPALPSLTYRSLGS